MKTILLLFSLLSPIMLFAQTSSNKITGHIETENEKAIESANILLYRAQDSAFVKADISDAMGSFEFENLQDGKYYFEVTHIAYQKYVSTNLELNASNKNNQNIVVTLHALSTEMKSITVTAKSKPFIERKFDKTIINVENSIVSTGNSVLEILQKSPGVLVNQESSINLKGKAGVMIMIDGKPTPLEGADLIAYLKTIQASNIQSIEIISNPSARYDASGNAGIINIKFKKNQKLGFNGSTALSYGIGVYAKPAISVNLNYRTKKMNYYATLSHSRPKDFTMFYINRKFFDSSHKVLSIFDQTSYIKRPIVANNARIGVDFYATEKTIIGAMFTLNSSSSQRDGKTNSIIQKPDGAIDFTTNNYITLNEKRFNGFANINFKHTFKKNVSDITADIDYGTFDAKTVQDIDNNNIGVGGQTLTLSKLYTNQVGNITVKSFKTDLTHSFSKNAKLEAGIKISLVTSDNDVKFYDVISHQNILDTSRSNHFVYKENINALYASYSKEFKKWDLQTGLRMEHTSTHGNQLASNETFKRSYVNFFPNAVMNRKFSEENSLSLSYTKRIDRPSYRQLNPFKIFVDAYTYVVGDPKLKSVLTNQLELNYTFKSKYMASIGYTKTKESITDIFQQDDATKISFQIPANMQNFEQLNLGVYLPYQYKRLVTSSLSGNVNYYNYTSPLQGSTINSTYVSWDANLNNNFTLGKNWSAELSAYYQSKTIWGLFMIKNLAQISCGFQKMSNNKKSTYKFAISDIFLTNHIAVIVNYQNQDFHTNRTWDSRVATLSYSYRFGKSTVEKARQRKTGVEDEKRRVG